MENYLDFIQKYNVGVEGTSVWMWKQSREGTWFCVGFAKDTVEESLQTLQEWINIEGGNL